MKVILNISALCFLGFGSLAYGQYEGRVGINTETPAATIDIKSKTGTDATTKNLELQNANGTKLVTVLDNGYVGIGTETPAVELSVIGGGNFTKGVNVEQTLAASWLMLHNYGKGLLSNNIRWRNGAYRFVRGTDTDVKEGGWLFHSDFNKDTPFLLSVASNEPTKEDDVANMINILTVNRAGNLGINTFNATEKLEVEGKIKTSSLAQSGAGDRPVFADENGVLKTGTFSAKASATDATCSATNEGAMHYKVVDRSGKQVGLFGFCTRDANGAFIWSYQLGGNNVFSVAGNQAFGTGL